MPSSLAALLAQLSQQGITDHRRYKSVRRFLDFKARGKGVPVAGSFELTPLCNLDCKMCYVHLNKQQMRGAQLMTTGQWKDIMQQAIDAGMMFARLTGGECLTYPGFKELYLFLRDRGVEVSILSNGLLMDEEMVEFLKKNPPAGIQISVYGASDEAYERVAGSRAFGRVKENLKRLEDAKMPLSVAVTPNAYMTDGLEILDFLHDSGYTYAVNSGLMQPREDTGRGLLEAENATYAAMLRRWREHSGGNFAEERDPESLPDPGGSETNSPLGVGCGAGRSNFAVDWQGMMRPCNTFPCEGQNVLELGFKEAWKRTNYTATHYPRPVECEGCAYKEICKHCVSEHAGGAEPGHANPKMCAWTRQMIAEGLLHLQ